MLRLYADGLITLPPSQIRQPRRAARFEPTSATDAQPAIRVAVHELAPLHMPLQLRIVRGRGIESRLWNEFIARYHYLGYTPMSGQQLRYSVYAGELWSRCSGSRPLPGSSPTGNSTWAGPTRSAADTCIAWSATPDS